jgi:hypothetical protein
VGTAIRIAIIVVWLGGLALLTTWSQTTPAIVAAFAATFVTGLLVGRWWLLIVPAVPLTYLILGSLLAGSEPDSDGATGYDWALWIAILSAPLVATLGTGVGLAKLARRYARPLGPRGAAPASHRP